ncbi:MAG TPA: serine/threonine-protein kinase [Gemmataceae bacterium]|nr:serine/threonine-protein kinase [Gemmataceae bacterium]
MEPHKRPQPIGQENPAVSVAITLDDPADKSDGLSARSGELLEVASVVPVLPLLQETPPEEPRDPNGVPTVAAGAGETAPPFQVPGYELLGSLGRGGMGIVYKARQVSLNRVVALKMILSGEHANRDALNRFSREAKAVARLQHPNIVQIYEIGHSGAHPYFSLEYLEGGSLQEQIARVSQTPRQAAELVETLARAVYYAHRQGIIHRDLKPANILLAADGTPKIADFGLAKQVADDSGQTRTGTILGTPAYMAPEQARGWGLIGPAADIYALGAVLYDLLTGRPPFEGTTVLDTLEMVQLHDPVPPQRHQPSIPTDLQTICLKCLHKTPAGRYLTAQNLADDLRRFLDGQPIQARPTPLWERVLKWVRRRPAQAALFAAGAAVLITLIVALAREAKNQHHLAELAQAESSREKKHVEEMRASRDKAWRQKEIAEANQRQAQLQAARASRLTGDIQEDRGMHEEARRAYHKAIALYERLLQGPSRPASLPAEVAGVYLNLWIVQAAANSFVDAEKTLDRACELLEPLVHQSGGDDVSKGELARCYNNRGIHFQIQGQPTKARDSYEQALALFRRMRPETRERPAYLLEMARVEKNLGVLHQQSNAPQRAERCYRDALTILRRLVQQAPEAVVYSNELGQVFLDLTGLLAGRGDAEAEAFYDESVRFFDALARKSDAIPDYRFLLALARTNRADVCRRSGDLARAREDLLEACRLLKRLHDDFPSRADFAVELARTLNRLAAVQESSGRQDEAGPTRQDVLALYDGLPAKAAGSLAVRRECQLVCDALLTWHDRQVRLLGQRGHVAKVAEHLRQLAALRKRRLQLFRSGPGPIVEAASMISAGPVHWVCEAAACIQRHHQEEMRREELARTRLVLAELLLQQKQHEEAADVLRDVAAPPDAPAKWGEYTRAAILAGRCLRQMRTEEGVSEAGRRRRVRSFAGPALVLLRRAAAPHDRDLPVFLANDAFAPLRALEGYAALVEELGRKPPGRPPLLPKR